MTAEAPILAGCLALLNWRRVPAWRTNAGMVITKAGHRVKLAPRGCADIIGCVPGSGKFLAIECKSPNGKIRPDQAAFLEAVRAANGVAWLIDDLGDLAGKLADLLGPHHEHRDEARGDAPGRIADAADL